MGQSGLGLASFAETRKKSVQVPWILILIFFSPPIILRGFCSVSGTAMAANNYEYHISNAH
jgi:hypothetical protein